ncbi:MAG: TetR/AcrR family transcriptional regulator [Pseudomonadaceae bacterium]|nr:TetR/AcrR family transcriptional regulator [Pseudomonadaceae bacterium]
MKTARATRSNNARELILDAAIRVVDKDGAGHLTIDAVATEVGRSKGGVLYHFPNKRALLNGMLARMIERELTALDTAPGNTPLGRHLHSTGNLRRDDKAASLALLAAAAEDPEMLGVMRDAYQQLFLQARADCKHPAEVNTILLAAEGLRLLSVLGVLPLSETEQRAVHKHLAARAEQL